MSIYFFNLHNVVFYRCRNMILWKKINYYCATYYYELAMCSTFQTKVFMIVAMSPDWHHLGQAMMYSVNKRIIVQIIYEHTKLNHKEWCTFFAKHRLGLHLQWYYNSYNLIFYFVLFLLFTGDHNLDWGTDTRLMWPPGMCLLMFWLVLCIMLPCNYMCTFQIKYLSTYL